MVNFLSYLTGKRTKCLFVIMSEESLFQESQAFDSDIFAFSKKFKTSTPKKNLSMKKKFNNMKKRPFHDDDEDDFANPNNFKTPKKNFKNPAESTNAPKKVVSFDLLHTSKFQKLLLNKSDCFRLKC